MWKMVVVVVIVVGVEIVVVTIGNIESSWWWCTIRRVCVCWLVVWFVLYVGSQQRWWFRSMVCVCVPLFTAVRYKMTHTRRSLVVFGISRASSNILIESYRSMFGERVPVRSGTNLVPENLAEFAGALLSFGCKRNHRCIIHKYRVYIHLYIHLYIYTTQHSIAAK